MTCERYQLWMTDAATGGLSAPQQTELDSHIYECTRCREDYGRVQRLLQEIDRGIVSRCDAAPSVEFLARVRRQIALAHKPTQSDRTWWVPAAACVTVFALAIVLWLRWPDHSNPNRISISAPMSNSSVAAVQPVRKASDTSTVVLVAKAAAASRAGRLPAIPGHLRSARGPEVLAPPGEAQAVLQYVATLRSGKIDGAKLMSDLKAAGQPIEIKPLDIAPLDSSVEDKNSPGPDSDGTRRDLLSGALIQSLVP